MSEPIIAVLKALFVWLIRWIPAWILRKKFNPQAVIESFGVELMTPTSVSIRLDQDDPTVSIYLRLLNFTPLTFEIEKPFVEIDIAGRKLGRIDHPDRIRVEPYTATPPFRYAGYSTMHDPKVFLRLDVDTGRAAAMRKHLAETDPYRREVQLMIFLRAVNQLGRFDSPPTEIKIPAEAADIRVVREQ